MRRLSELFLGFTMWNIWKERNNRIFEGRSHSPEDIWKQTRLHIRGTLGLRIWESADLKANQIETRILSNWGIISIPSYIGPSRENRDLVQSPEKWNPPPQTIYKLNFDGQLKKNLGLQVLEVPSET